MIINKAVFRLFGQGELLVLTTYFTSLFNFYYIKNLFHIKWIIS
jgi:hypothetical protein